MSGAVSIASSSDFTSASASARQWWKDAVIYQIYPASFCDSNGDGWGDVKGITSKLDYIKNLGIDVLWLSPIYKSPQADMGYDISDYKDIDPRYGSLEDVDELIAELHKRDMKLMMDLVVNHTSDQHAWFLESRSSKNNPKRDWYIWRPAKYDAEGKRHPPNNWSQILGEANSAWTWDPVTEEYYLSLFTPDQPDLNWENPVVREAVHDVLRFWLDRGTSGFRMDVINLISKVPGYPDGAVVDLIHEYQPGDKYFANGPRLHEYLQEMNEKVLSHYDTITVGEMPFVRDEDEILRIVHPERKELNMIFLFEHVDIDNTPGTFRMTLHPWKRSAMREIFTKYQNMMQERGGWNSIFLENHDNPRSVSRYTDESDEYRDICAKLLCLMATTLCGTLYVYQGQELGMRNVPMEWSPEEYKDIETVNYWKKMQTMYPGDTEMLGLAKTIIHKKARDHSRTPVQWTGEAPNAGFCKPDVKPWMRVNDDYHLCNAEAQVGLKTSTQISVYEFWKQALHERKKHKETLVYGNFEQIGPDHEDNPVFGYKRSCENDAWIVILNFSPEETKWEIPAEAGPIERWVTGNYEIGEPKKELSGTITLRPWEGVLGRCSI